MIHSNRRLHRPVIVAAFLGLTIAAWTVPAPVLAQGTPDQRQACSGDAQRLCSHTIPDERTTGRCLAANRRNLSPACRAVFGGKARKVKRSRRR
jgi:predicted metal-binding membrane protein